MIATATQRCWAQLHDAGDGKLTFSLGCDLQLSCENIHDAMTRPRQYTIGDSQYLLVELNHLRLSRTLKQDLLGITSCGMVPIITHPERNRVLLEKPALLLELIDQGCLVQVTANSFTGFWGERPQKMAEWLLQREAIHVVASDAHDASRRTPVLSKAREVVAELAGAEVAEALFQHNPAAITDGESLRYRAALA